MRSGQNGASMPRKLYLAGQALSFATPAPSRLAGNRHIPRVKGDKAMTSTKQSAVIEGDKRMPTNRQTTTAVASPRTIALVTGVLFIITYITSIPPVLFLYGPVLHDPRYIVGAGPDTGALFGAFLELLLIVANIGTTVVLFPILKRVNEIFALGYVTARVVESVFIAVGILSLLAVVTLRQDVAGAANADASSLVAVGKSLVALHDWTFLLGPGFVVGIGNGLLLGYLMYKSALVPQRMAMLGLIAGPVLLARFVGILFGVVEPGSVVGSLMVVPEFIWELALGIWLIVKGFNPAAVASGSARTGANDLASAASSAA